MLLVTSAIRIYSMPLVRWMVLMFVDCFCFSAILMSSSAMLLTLVFVFSHRILNCFGDFFIWFFEYSVLHDDSQKRINILFERCSVWNHSKYYRVLLLPILSMCEKKELHFFLMRCSLSKQSKSLCELLMTYSDAPQNNLLISQNL